MTRQPDSLARFPLVFALVAFFCIAPVACKTFFKPAVTLTQVTQGALKCYSTAIKAGAVSPDLATKVSSAYRQYWQAAQNARDAKSHDPATWAQAFAIAKMEATTFVMLVVPLCVVHESIALQNGLKLASEI